MKVATLRLFLEYSFFVSRLHNLRLRLLERLLQYMPEVREVGGVCAIPYMQVILMLTSDLDGDEEKDRLALDMLLNCMLKELDICQKDGDSGISTRSSRHEVKLIIMRLLSVLMSRSRVGMKSSGEVREISSFLLLLCSL